MDTRRRYSQKPRPVARGDWEERADEALKSLWSSKPNEGDKRRNKRMGFFPNQPARSPGQRKHPTSEASAFAKAIQDKPFELNYHTIPRHFGTKNGKVQPTTSQMGLFNDDASLKHARRRIRLAQDFDEMLRKGFPNLSLSKTDPEFTLYISLTPKVASIPSAPKV